VLAFLPHRLDLSLPPSPHHAQVSETLQECRHVYDMLFNTVPMSDEYKDTGHVGTNPELQRSFWRAQSQTLKFMWNSIIDRMLATVWPDLDIEEFDTALPVDFVILFWYFSLIIYFTIPTYPNSVLDLPPQCAIMIELELGRTSSSGVHGFVHRCRSGRHRSVMSAELLMSAFSIARSLAISRPERYGQCEVG
jgi:hypothetical protein